MRFLSKIFSKFKKEKIEQPVGEAWPWPTVAPKESIAPEEPEVKTVKAPAKKTRKSTAGKK